MRKKEEEEEGKAAAHTDARIPGGVDLLRLIRCCKEREPTRSYSKKKGKKKKPMMKSLVLVHYKRAYNLLPL